MDEHEERARGDRHHEREPGKSATTAALEAALTLKVLDSIKAFDTHVLTAFCSRIDAKLDEIAHLFTRAHVAEMQKIDRETDDIAALIETATGGNVTEGQITELRAVVERLRLIGKATTQTVT